MSRLFVAGAVLALLTAAAAGAEPRHTLRIATVAPDGTAWAREMRSFAREVEEQSKGEVRLKLYFGGMAGDDVQSATRVERGQLDGVAGAMLCQKVAPSHRALRLVGVFRSREEADYAAGALRTTFEEEARTRGYVYLGDVSMGFSSFFTRKPLTTLAELRSKPFWVWDTDVVMAGLLKDMGFSLKLLPVDEAAKAYTDGRHDGFISIPGAMLAFQWSVQAKYVNDLRVSYLTACFLVANRAFDKMPLVHQQALKGAAARLRTRLSAQIREQDEALIGGLFRHQGLINVPVSESLRKEFLDAARISLDRVGATLLPPALIKRVEDVLADYRGRHPAKAGP